MKRLATLAELYPRYGAITVKARHEPNSPRDAGHPRAIERIWWDLDVGELAAFVRFGERLADRLTRGAGHSELS